MIYTVTCNPSLDLILDVPQFITGMTNRATSEQLVPGGKGINVSTVLHHLEIPSTAIFFSAGFTGEEITRAVRGRGIRAEAISLKEGNSRINVKLKTDEGTEINGRGPAIPAEKQQELLHRLNHLGKKDTLVLAGSIPESMPKAFYGEILQRLEGKGIRCVVDASGDSLLAALPGHPFLVKPNHHELGEIFGIRIEDRQSALIYARELQKRGARHVLVSLGGQGAVLAAEDGTVWDSPAPKGTLVHAVGSGDAMVAGFLAGWEERADPKHAFLLALSAGSASAFSEGFATKEEIEAVYASLQ